MRITLLGKYLRGITSRETVFRVTNFIMNSIMKTASVSLTHSLALFPSLTAHAVSLFLARVRAIRE